MCSTPLASWRFSGSLRTYQADALDRLPTGSADPLHVVAPPGSGKTLLGLLLAPVRAIAPSFSLPRW
jgi:superfamily II DNA or RNA helicase